jgi:hypothetical protein
VLPSRGLFAPAGLFVELVDVKPRNALSVPW